MNIFKYTFYFFIVFVIQFVTQKLEIIYYSKREEKCIIRVVIFFKWEIVGFLFVLVRNFVQSQGVINVGKI